MQSNSDALGDEYDRLAKSKFKQQKLPAWRPVPTIMSTTIIFVSFGIIFIAIGIIVLIYSGKIVEYSKRYDNDCTSQNACEIHIKINKKMESPVMLYYQLDNFYQNHRRYVKSKSDKQLNGNYQSKKSIVDSGDCDPVVTNEDMGKTVSVSGTPLNSKEVAVPCGLIAKSFFNDKYELFQGNTTEESKKIFINEKDIAWSADKKLKYKNTKDKIEGKSWTEFQWIDMEDEHFIVWMRLAGLPNFRKLWGRIEKDLEGDYTFKIENNFEVADFSGKKYIVLSTVNAFGGKNTFLGVAYIVVGVVCILLAVVFLIGYQIRQRNEKEKKEEGKNKQKES